MRTRRRSGGDAGLRSGPKRQMKNPDDFGGDYDKIREELMTQGYRGWASNLSISNTINWLSENTFGAGGTSLGRGIDAVAGAYRKFLDALPYRRQDGGQRGAPPRSRAAEAYKRWEAFKAGESNRTAMAPVRGRQAGNAAQSEMCVRVLDQGVGGGRGG